MYINNVQYGSNINDKLSMRYIFSNYIISDPFFQECLSTEYPMSVISFNGNSIIISHCNNDNMYDKINSAIDRCIKNYTKDHIRDIKKENHAKIRNTSCAYNAYYIGDTIYIEA